MLLGLVDFAALPEMPEQWGYLVILGVVHTYVMYIFLYSSIQKQPMIIIATLAFLYPATVILVDYAVFAVRLDRWQWLGVVLILISASVVSLPET
jgi:drug/metabolite transporter (DMT)-like permease